MTATRRPAFSILTASYNRGETIGRTLQSLSTQTFRDFEHIVVDGQSTDRTLDILTEYASKYNLTWISESDRGIAHALNKGLGISQGNYILVIQADDYISGNDVLQEVHSLIKEEPYDILSFPVLFESPEHGLVLRTPIPWLWWNHFKFIFLHQGVFVHRRVFQKIGGFRETFRIAMDYDFFYRALANHCSVRFGTLPIAMMGGDGIGSRLTSLERRLKEEALVQDLNESDPFWRAAQAAFRKCYVPYKLRLLPFWRGLRLRFNSPDSDPGSRRG
jgi:glycosyltransferase involved in cell wall biosynthesis